MSEGKREFRRSGEGLEVLGDCRIRVGWHTQVLGRSPFWKGVGFVCIFVHLMLNSLKCMRFLLRSQRRGFQAIFLVWYLLLHFWTLLELLCCCFLSDSDKLLVVTQLVHCWVLVLSKGNNSGIACSRSLECLEGLLKRSTLYCMSMWSGVSIGCFFCIFMCVREWMLKDKMDIQIVIWMVTNYCLEDLWWSSPLVCLQKYSIIEKSIHGYVW